MSNPGMFGTVTGTGNRIELCSLSSAGFEHVAKPQRLANDWVIQEQVGGGGGGVGGVMAGCPAVLGGGETPSSTVGGIERQVQGNSGAGEERVQEQVEEGVSKQMG